MKWKNGFTSQGERRSHLIGLNDIYATLSNLAGVAVPPGQAIDSLNYANYILDKSNTDNLRDYLGVWTVKEGAVDDESIRKQNLKLIRNRHSGTKRLFDLENDISETTNLIRQAQYSNDIKDMIEKLEEISPCYDTQGKFDIIKNDGKSEQVNCNWFAKQKGRCYQYLEGPINCRLSCAGYSQRACIRSSTSNRPPTKSPTAEPTSSSSSSNNCVDAIGQFKVQGTFRTCTWAKRTNTKKRCKKFKVAQKCPVVCGSCPS